MKYISGAVDKVRRQEHKELRKEGVRYRVGRIEPTPDGGGKGKIRWIAAP